MPFEANKPCRGRYGLWVVFYLHGASGRSGLRAATWAERRARQCRACIYLE